jgi:hypothetical protein
MSDRHPVTPERLTAWADKIDNRLGPISGRDADILAVTLREAAIRMRALIGALCEEDGLHDRLDLMHKPAEH